MAGKDGDRVSTVIGKDALFRGTLEGEGAVRIDGRFEGDLSTAGDVIIGEGGFLQGTIAAKNVIIAGGLQGKVEARGKLELLPTAHVEGEIKMALLVVEEGAFFHGNCEAMPRGDLKERGKALKAETPAEKK